MWVRRPGPEQVIFYTSSERVLMTDLEIRRQLEKILASDKFARSPRLSVLFRYLVEESLEGRGESLKEYSIGLAIFDRPDSYDPRVDSVVRVQAGNLRKRLKTYYGNAGSEDAIVIEFPKGGYTPVFRMALVGKSRARRLARDWAFGITVCLAVVVVAGLLVKGRSDGPQTGFPLKQVTFDTGWTGDARVTPDGSLVVYASDRGGNGGTDIWMKRIEGGEPVRLTTHAANDITPDVSHDGKWVAFHSFRDGGGIYLISTQGGEERKIIDRGFHPRLSPDGNWIAFGRKENDGNWRTWVTDRSGQRWGKIGHELSNTGSAVWSPSGRYLALRGSSPDQEFDIYTIPFGTTISQPAKATGIAQAIGKAKLPWLGSTSMISSWTGDSLLFPMGHQKVLEVWRARLSPVSLTVTGDVERVVPGPDVRNASVFKDRDGQSWVVFGSDRETSDYWSIGTTGAQTGKVVQMTKDSSLRRGIQEFRGVVAGNGSRLFYASARNGGVDIWMQEPPRGEPRLVSGSPDWEDWVTVNWDGSKIAFGRRGSRSRRPDIFIWEEGKSLRKVCEFCGVPTSMTRDGSRLLYLRGRAIHELDMRTGNDRALLPIPAYNAEQADYSPDGEWIAFAAGSSSEPHVTGYASRIGDLSQPERWVRIESQSYYFTVHWSLDGNWLYYFHQRDGFRCLYTQRFDRASRRTVGEPVAIHHFHGSQPYPWGGSWISVVEDRLVVKLTSHSGNIWMGRLFQKF